jgi:hypothetical protein
MAGGQTIGKLPLAAATQYLGNSQQHVCYRMRRARGT